MFLSFTSRELEKGGEAHTFQTIQGDGADGNTNHWFGMVVKLTADGEKREWICRLGLPVRKTSEKRIHNYKRTELCHL